MSNELPHLSLLIAQKHVLLFFCLIQKLTTHCSPLIAHLRAIENLLQNKCAVIRAFLPINAKKSSWAEKSAQLEKNMFPVREIFFPSWKPQIRGLYENMTFPAGNPYKSKVSDF